MSESRLGALVVVLVLVGGCAGILAGEWVFGRSLAPHSRPGEAGHQPLSVRKDGGEVWFAQMPPDAGSMPDICVPGRPCWSATELPERCR